MGRQQRDIRRLACTGTPPRATAVSVPASVNSLLVPPAVPVALKVIVPSSTLLSELTLGAPSANGYIAPLVPSSEIMGKLGMKKSEEFTSIAWISTGGLLVGAVAFTTTSTVTRFAKADQSGDGSLSCK